MFDAFWCFFSTKLCGLFKCVINVEKNPMEGVGESSDLPLVPSNPVYTELTWGHFEYPSLIYLSQSIYIEYLLCASCTVKPRGGCRDEKGTDSALKMFTASGTDRLLPKQLINKARRYTCSEGNSAAWGIRRGRL